MLLQKIAALATVNQEIIDRLKQRKGKVITGYNYNCTPQLSIFHMMAARRYASMAERETLVNQLIRTLQLSPLEEQPKILDAEVYIRNVTLNIPLHIIEDVDRINYNCQRFSDLERLNRDMLRVARKYLHTSLAIVLETSIATL
jgi:hypothetical protein